ncbi:LutC/YkgG family protein [Chitinophaga qingshengii]|uniref:LUD domain-containing protein n=1 Tax=Chitinophaga qingshengii TaxID=1569794 RepID=A0ABR7TMZ5_9BACT|nr:LUD domain-containing protein [Chitinophaga qingshengii]MBC9931368.1 LUD domain-containing protein [Chitinophaga qingshengii]
MKISPAKENILKRVRNALSQPVQLPFPNSEGNSAVFKTENEGLELKFAEEFARLQGKFVFCTSKAELLENLRVLSENKEWRNVYCQTPSLLKLIGKNDLPSLNQGNIHEADAAITDCEYLIARTGTVVLSAAQPSGRVVPVYAPVHVMVAYTHQLVFDLKDAFSRLKDKYGNDLPSAVSFATGPSRTADIEKTLVVGIHGPKEVYVFLVDE